MRAVSILQENAPPSQPVFQFFVILAPEPGSASISSPGILGVVESAFLTTYFGSSCLDSPVDSQSLAFDFIVVVDRPREPPILFSRSCFSHDGRQKENEDDLQHRRSWTENKQRLLYPETWPIGRRQLEIEIQV